MVNEGKIGRVELKRFFRRGYDFEIGFGGYPMCR